MRILDLCAGTHSVNRAVRKIDRMAEITSVDINAKYSPTILTDILHWDYKNAFPPGYFDYIWASPPCTHYSVARTRGGERNFKHADALVKRCLQIIMYFRPSVWYLENPGGAGHLHRRPFMKPWNRYINECCYCRYGYPYKKRTHIWSNQSPLNLKMCSNETPCRTFAKHNRHLFIAQQSRHTPNEYEALGTKRLYDRYSVPPKLLVYLFSIGHLKKLNLKS